MRGRRGFTFLELLVALAVLGASFTALLVAHASALKQEARARRLLTATLLARDILTRTETEGLPPLGADQGEFEEFPGYTWERQTETTEFPNVRLVRIAVSWPEGNRRESTEIEFYAWAEEDAP
ncbi:MAG: prepilin-type N-terminal cleavage/methylation domain-containing protein [Candidatus Dadabacteria bacterium]|nr:MAG: prepilin-type N-terminal cleavage/methylation domain-containing protein [Candidatus Dadabacteria bacterium]